MKKGLEEKFTLGGQILGLGLAVGAGLYVSGEVNYRSDIEIKQAFVVATIATGILSCPVLGYLGSRMGRYMDGNNKRKKRYDL